MIGLPDLWAVGGWSPLRERKRAGFSIPRRSGDGTRVLDAPVGDEDLLYSTRQSATRTCALEDRVELLDGHQLDPGVLPGPTSDRRVAAVKPLWG